VARNPCLAAALAELEAAGIRDVTVAHGGKHPQLRFRINGGALHVFAVPGTAGDWRSPANVRSDLRRYLREAGVCLAEPQSKGTERLPSRMELLERRVTELERRLARVEGV
jgi:hypothetical protein